MPMVPFQWFLVIIAQLILLRIVIKRFQQHTISSFDLVILASLDIGFCFFVISPEILERLSHRVGVLSIFLYGGILTLFFLVFKLFAKLEKIREDITKLNRAIVLKEFREQQNKEAR
ncbi:hypothetical protein U14_05032 [Candidatus Moduliflexus flocculans]|uniref:DUF2304 domain-containing protein n=1 Tax=Candidatus Moduliflexus flocculans TaxID=1499966 RepID=A0A081BQS7_9BACT|nr:hypothetical protein U14_05032 [Candidatus Moduliflexus flocculans]